MKNKYWAFALTLLSAAAIQAQEKDSLPEKILRPSRGYHFRKTD